MAPPEDPAPEPAPAPAPPELGAALAEAALVLEGAAYCAGAMASFAGVTWALF
jgi:hypothetical protein